MWWRVVQKCRRQSGGIAMQIQMRQANQNGGVRHRKLVRCQSGCISYQCSKQTGKQKHTNKIRKIMHQLGASRKSTLTPFTPLRTYSILRGIWLPPGMPHITNALWWADSHSRRYLIEKGECFLHIPNAPPRNHMAKTIPDLKRPGLLRAHCLWVSFPWNKGILWL